MVRRNNKSNSNKQMIVALKHTVLGHNIRPKNDPPLVVAVPWNSLTLRYSDTATSGTKTISGIHSSLLTQLRLDGKTPAVALEFRLLEIRQWSISGSATLETVLYDSSNADNGTLCQLQDRGTPARLACIGYKFPAIVSTNTAFGNTESGRKLYEYATSSGGVVTHLRILWRTY